MELLRSKVAGDLKRLETLTSVTSPAQYTLYAAQIAVSSPEAVLESYLHQLQSRSRSCCPVSAARANYAIQILSDDLHILLINATFSPRGNFLWKPGRTSFGSFSDTYNQTAEMFVSVKISNCSVRVLCTQDAINSCAVSHTIVCMHDFRVPLNFVLSA